jgi:acetyl esterase/lipase
MMGAETPLPIPSLSLYGARRGRSSCRDALIRSDGMPLDPHARRFLDLIAAGGAQDVARMSPREMRLGFFRLSQLVGAKDEPIGRIEDRTLAGPAGPLPIRVYTPLGAADEELPGLVYFHGGGGVFGSIETHDGLCRMLANASECRVLSVEYRLAPEHAFPAAFDDSCAAVTEVFEHAAGLGLRANRIAVGGDSAGAALAAAVCQRAKLENGPSIALQFLLCPALDIGTESESRRAFAAGYFLDKATIDWTLKHYCPETLDPADPRLSPLRAADVSRQPPAHVHTAEFDPLLCEGRTYADRLERAGVDVRYTCHAGMIHHFYGMADAIPYARVAIAEIGADIKRALASTESIRGTSGLANPTE